MAIQGLSLSETEEYILKTDPGNPEHPDYQAAIAMAHTPDTPTVFMLRNITLADRVSIGDTVPISTMTAEGSITLTSRDYERLVMTLRAGLSGWRGMGGPKPSVSFSGMSPEDIDTALTVLPSSVIDELAGAILERNGMTDSIQKKLEGALLPPAAQPLKAGNAPSAQKSSNGNGAAKKQQRRK